VASGNATVLEETRITAGHELFHILQSDYDPREYLVLFRYSPWYWMDEAAAVWFERAVSTEPNYVSGLMRDQMDFLLKGGLEQTTTLSVFGPTGVKNHGCGASSFLQHLAPASSGNAPSKIGDVIRLMGVRRQLNFPADDN
jgi:hypothetical protein